MNNPYQVPPPVAEVATESVASDEFPIEFSGKLDEKQFRSLFGGWWLPIVGILGFGYFLNEIWFPVQTFVRSDPAAVAAIVIIGISAIRWTATQFWNRIGPGFLNRFKRISANSFLPQIGRLDSDWLTLCTESISTRIARRSFVKIFANHQSAWLLLDSLGGSSYLTTASLFEADQFQQFVAACGEDVKKNRYGFVSFWNHPVLKQADQVLPLDDPTHDSWLDSIETTLVQSPNPSRNSESVYCSGISIKRQLMVPKLKEHVRVFTLWLIFDLAWSAITYAAMGYLLASINPLLLLVGIPLLLLTGQRLYARLASLGMYVGKDAIVMAQQALIRADRVDVATPLQITRYRWSAFQGFDQSVDFLTLQLKGKYGGSIVFPRDHFQSEQDWQTAGSIFQASVPGASATSNR